MDARNIPIKTLIKTLQEENIYEESFLPEGEKVSEGFIRGCAFDSRQVEKKNLFFAKGIHFRPVYLKKAMEGGAACYVADIRIAHELQEISDDLKIPGIYVSDIRRAMAVLSPLIYGHPERKLPIIGITGTKGKSTSCYMLHAMLCEAGHPAGILGSIVNDDGIERYEAQNTTPEAPELWRHLANAGEAGLRAMVIETSSQALKYERVYGIPFEIACFTNISSDHISAIEHPDQEDYLASKLRIFRNCRVAVVQLGTAHLDEVMAAASSAGTLRTVGIEHPEADAWATDIHSGRDSGSFTLHLSPALSDSGQPEMYRLRIAMPGEFNVENALVAVACARILGVSMEHIAEVLAHIRVPGRMNIVHSEDGQITGIVDFAHNKAAFEAMFSYVEQAYPGHTVISIFGVHGDRGGARRRECPPVAARYSDYILISEQDPAHDDLMALCEEVAANLSPGTAYEIEPDRERAAEKAFSYARTYAPAVVLMLGKGAETHQQRGGDFYDVKGDIELVRQFIDAIC